MVSRDNRKNLMAIAAFVLPVVIVKLTTAFLGNPTPQSANATSAQPASMEHAPSPPSAAKQSPQQLAAAQHIQALLHEPFGMQPFLYEKSTPEPETTEPTPTITPTQPTEVSVPRFSLGAVMSSATGRRALINGRPYREGEVIKDTSWHVASIDPAKRSVTLQESNGNRSITINVDLP